ncbi:MAG: hypothetical protein LBK66_01795, partial [Spirochaetaceae bacterium]|nr:hypothetical protein [Spirochaetaceae bacterium]
MRLASANLAAYPAAKNQGCPLPQCGRKRRSLHETEKNIGDGAHLRDDVLARRGYWRLRRPRGGGNGSLENPLQIGSAADLLEFKSRVDGGETSLCAVLTADIEVADTWASIAAGGLDAGTSDSTVPYVGTFDGNGKTLTLKNESTTTSEGRAIALFHTIGTEGVVKNLNLDLTFKGHSYMAGVAVRNYGTIEYVTTTGVVKPKPSTGYTVYAAGIVVYNGCKEVSGQYVPGKILNCVNFAEIGINRNSTGMLSDQMAGGQYMAGIAAGFVGEMRNCANYGTIWANSNFPAGGLFTLPNSNADGTSSNGEPIKQVIVSDCYNAGTVNVVINTQGSWTDAKSVAGLFGATTDGYYAPWISAGKFAISNVFNYGTVRNPYESIIGDLVQANIIGLGVLDTFTDFHVVAAFSNIYYLPESGTAIFGGTHVAGDDGYGTDRVKTVIHPRTAEEFASADMAAALNAGRTGADAPWEYIVGNDYPTLKIEREGYDPDDDIYTPDPTTIDITAAAGYGGIIEFDEEESVFTVTANEDYRIDVIYIDGVAATAAQAVPADGGALHGAQSAVIDVSSGYDDVTSIVATFAYTVNFPDPANGTLSVSRGGDTLTSGSIVRAGEILTVSYTGTDELIFSGFEQTGDTDQYKVVARRDAPPSISFEAGTPGPVD